MLIQLKHERESKITAMTASFMDIKADMLARIRSREWAPGARLPDETDLAAHYGCARSTVARAMRDLVGDGLIERRRKAGTRVRLAPLRQARFDIPIVGDEITDTGAGYRYALVRSEVGSAPDWLRARMALRPGVEARHLLCLHFADGQPYQFEDRWINLDAVPSAREHDFGTQGPNEWLVRQIPFSAAEISFSAVDATEEQAQHLDCAPGDALFCVERHTRWEGQVLTFVRLVFRRGHRITTTC